jgi:hypothetical protein
MKKSAIRKNKKDKKKILKTKNYPALLIIFFVFFCLLVLGVIILGIDELTYRNNGDDHFYNYGEFNTLNGFKTSPNGSIVSFFYGESKTFNISNINYTAIYWYYDNVSVKNNSREFVVEGKQPGNHTLEVKIYNGNNKDSKIWKVIIEGDSERKFVFDTGTVMFWVILIVVILLIFMMVWIIAREILARNRSKRLDYNANPKKDPVLDLNPARK